MKAAKGFGSLQLTATAAFSAMAVVLTAYVGALFPSPTGGYTHIGDTAIFLAGLLFGPLVGGYVGAIGPAIADFIVGYPRWYVSIVAHGVEGVLAGLARGRRMAVQAGLLALAGFVMASTYFAVNVFIKGFPLALISYARDLFGQALISLVLAVLVYKAVVRAVPRLASAQ